MKRPTLLLLALLATARLHAQGLMTELIDIPTADAVDKYGFHTSFRFYNGGGVLSKANFGVFPRLNIGFGIDTEQLVGSNTVDVNRPTLNAKLRFFDGKRQLPALALGYDGQGYFFNEDTDKYNQRERGLYLVGGGEILTPGLSLHGGANIYDFDDDRVFCFAGISYMIQEVVALSFEADNMRKGRDNRLNTGVRYYVTPSFAIDLAGRDLWAAGRKAERIVRLGYYGSF